MRRASSIRAAHLAIGAKKAGKSISWKPSRSRSPRATSPMNRIIGVESWKATWTPRAGVGRAGAAGDEGDAGAAGHLAVGVGHVGDPAFLAADDGVDLGRVVQRVEHREEAFARHGEDAVAALDAELVDEDAAAGADLERSHGLPPIGAAREAEAGIRIANQGPGLIHVSDSDPLEADDLARAKGCKCWKTIAIITGGGRRRKLPRPRVRRARPSLRCIGHWPSDIWRLPANRSRRWRAQQMPAIRS